MAESPLVRRSQFFLVSTLIGGGCFSEPAGVVDSESAGMTDGTTTTTTTATTESSSTPSSTTTTTTSSSGSSSTTLEPTTDIGPETDSAPDTDELTEGPTCEEPGCPCNGDECPAGLTCVAGTCTDCGNGTVEPPELCDGDVDNADCRECVFVCADGFADCDGRPDNGCEADLSAASDCGGCGHDCLGGDCDSQVCQPVDIAGGEAEPLGLDVEGEFLFWTTLTTGSVVVKRLGSADPPEVLISGLSSPETVVADGSHVYWADTFGDEAGAGGVGRARYDGSDLDAEWLTAAEASDTRLLLSTALHLVALRIFDAPVRAPKGLGFPEDVVATGAASGGFLDGDLLYWADTGAGEILRADIGGGAVLPTSAEIMVSNQPDVFAVYVHDDVLYWTTAAVGTGAVRSQPLDGGAIIEYASTLTFSEDLVVDDDHVYWVERFSGGSLWRADLDGNNVTPLHSASSAGIDHDDQAIYWVEQDGGRIRMLAK